MQPSSSLLDFECKIDMGRSGWLGRGRRAFVQVFDGRGPLVAQVPEQDIAELAAGTAAQRVQDGLVLAHRLAPALPLAGEIGGVADPADPSREAGVSAPERRVARGL